MAVQGVSTPVSHTVGAMGDARSRFATLLSLSFNTYAMITPARCLSGLQMPHDGVRSRAEDHASPSPRSMRADRLNRAI
jgi:hypothetical protein